jgi:predicted Zn-dependent protease
MSVINQMLHDLESRRSQITSGNNFSYQNLSFIPKLSSSNKVETVIYGVIACVTIISVALVFLKVQNEGNEIVSTALANTQTQQEAGSKSNIIRKPEIKTAITINENSKPVTEYEVPTSIIHPREKIVVKKISPIKTMKKPVSFSEVAVVKIDLSNNDDFNGVVHKRQRELSIPQKAENLYQSGYKYILARNTVKAQEELRNALMIMPSHNKSRELLTGIYIKSARIVEARTLLQYGIRISPNHTIFAKLYARILMEQNDNITAISVLLRHPPALRADADYHALLAALYQKNKQHQEAATVYSQLLKLRQSNGVWWLGMAISLEALGNNLQAKLAYEKAKNSGNLSEGLTQYTHQRVTALEEIAYP